jgi:O-acetyl-ADP-ribose deacetylase (regulator of RNase III)
MSDRNSVFISYCHRDRELMEEFRTHLAPLAKRGRLEFWVDSKIDAGDSWLEEIDNALDRASVAVMLVSKHFLASNFIMEYEVPYLLDAKQQHGVKLFQVILGRCCFGLFDDLNQFQAINKPERPLMALTEVERDEVWVELTHRIVAALGLESDKKKPEWNRRKPEKVAALIGQVEVVQGNLGQQDVDAIVISASHLMNGADRGLMEPGIHRLAGPKLAEYTADLAPLAYGNAVISPGFDLKARHVIHASVPGWRGGTKGEETLMASCYRKALDLARENGAKTVAFGTLGIGAKRTPVDRAARAAFEAMGEYLATSAPAGTRLSIVCWDDATAAAYRAVQQELVRTKAEKLVPPAP